MQRWLGFVGVFSAAARSHEDAVARAMALSEDEVAAFEAATAAGVVSFGPQADPLLLINSFNPTERAVWWRTIPPKKRSTILLESDSDGDNARSSGTDGCSGVRWWRARHA